MGAAEIQGERARRVFVEARELPGLVLGTARAEPRACRRVLGARYGGRFGALLALAGLALTAPSLAVALYATALHVALTLLTGLANRRRAAVSHTTREVQRLAMWTVVTPLCVGALLRAAAGLGAWPVTLAALAGQALLWRALAASR